MTCPKRQLQPERYVKWWVAGICCILCYAASPQQAGLLPQIDAFPLLGRSEAARKPDTGWHLPKIFF
jgi:hypothetical protein